MRIETLLLLGGIQGLILAAFLAFHKRGNQQANRQLGLLLLACSLYLILPEMTKRYLLTWPHLVAIAFPVIFLFGPTAYLYAKALTTQSDAQNNPTYLHFLATLLPVILLGPFYIKSGQEKIDFFEHIVENGLSIDFLIVWNLGCLHVIMYTTQARKLVINYNKVIRQNWSQIDHINLKWLEIFLNLNALLWLMYAVVILLYNFNIAQDPMGIADQLFGACLSLFIYGMGYYVLKKPEVFSGYLPRSSVKYVKSTLTSEQSKIYITQLEEFMIREKPFLDPDLSLQDLAALTSINIKHLSQVINEELSTNFYYFINNYRARESADLLEDPRLQHLTLLAIAYKAGFKSKSTFNDSFKRVQGRTPSQYRNTFLK